MESSMSRCPSLQCELSVARRGTAARLLVTLGLSLITTACGPAVARELFPVETWISAPPRLTPSHVEWRDLAPVQDATLDPALMRLRPEWFRFASSAYSASESARVVVYVDDVLTGAPETLRDVPIRAVVDVR